jgi:hypothetical protein
MTHARRRSLSRLFIWAMGEPDARLARLAFDRVSAALALAA